MNQQRYHGTKSLFPTAMHTVHQPFAQTFYIVFDLHSFDFKSCDSNCPSLFNRIILLLLGIMLPILVCGLLFVWVKFDSKQPPVPRLAQKHREQLTTAVQLQAMMSPWQHPLYIQRVWCVFEFSHAIMENKAGARVLRALLPGICSDVRVRFRMMTGFLRTLHSVFSYRWLTQSWY